mmetsp:Transcript_25833/g.50616  ORF Transcript_25833/g.50616 Transcript_25833/m.50616 type:complete len:120 (+) Transcript_25833:810-1169(+)
MLVAGREGGREGGSSIDREGMCCMTDSFSCLHFHFLSLLWKEAREGAEGVEESFDGGEKKERERGIKSEGRETCRKGKRPSDQRGTARWVMLACSGPSFLPAAFFSFFFLIFRLLAELN